MDILNALSEVFLLTDHPSLWALAVLGGIAIGTLIVWRFLRVPFWFISLLGVLPFLALHVESPLSAFTAGQPAALVVLGGWSVLVALGLALLLLRSLLQLVSPVSSPSGLPLVLAMLFSLALAAVVYFWPGVQQSTAAAAVQLCMLGCGGFAAVLVCTALLKFMRLGLIVGVWGLVCFILLGGLAAEELSAQSLQAELGPVIEYVAARISDAQGFLQKG